MDDGIELNFAAPSSSGGAGQRAGGNKKKTGGSWVQRLKANKAVKRRAERPAQSAPAGIQVAANPIAARPSQPQASTNSRPNTVVPRISTGTTATTTNVDASSSSSAYSRPKPAPKPVAARPARPFSSSNTSSLGTKGKDRAMNRAGGDNTDDGSQLDVSALAKRSVGNGAAFVATNTQLNGSERSTQNTAVPGLQKASARPERVQGATAASAPAPTVVPAPPIVGHQVISSLFSSLPSRTADSSKLDGEDDEVHDGTAKPDVAPSNAPTDTSTFSGLGLDPLITHHLSAKLGIKAPTRIQRVVLKGMLDPTPLTTSSEPGDFHVADHLGTADSSMRLRDAFIQSQTGSGKTLAYLLPIMQSLLPLASKKGYYVDRSIGTLAIILAPTRELARQIEEVLEGLLSLSMSLPENTTPETRHNVYKRYLVAAVLTGGATRNHEKTRLRKGCPVVVCTPGRLLDHLQNTQSFRVDKLMWLVLDEADRLIEEGFGETLGGIMKALEGRRKIGYEADMSLLRAGDSRPKPRSMAKPRHMTYSENNLPDFLKDESDDEDEDDAWDYETMGPKPKRSKAGAKETAKFEEEDVKADEPVESLAAGTTTAWPYWNLGRRTILCSATISGEVQKLAHVALRNPIMYRGSDLKDEDGNEAPEPELKPVTSVTVGAKEKEKAGALTASTTSFADALSKDDEKFTPPSQLDQRYVVVPLKLRLVSLVALMRSLIAKANAQGGEEGMKIIVFMSCTDSVDYHWKLFGGVKMGAAAAGALPEDGSEPVSYTCPLLPSTQIMRLHGSLPLQTRRTSLSAFASSNSSSTNKNSILLCTSVASRGLDMPLVRAVIQYDLPTEQGINEYVHRVGRTARVGRGGESWAFVSDKEVNWVPWVEEGMSDKDKAKVQMRQVGVEDVLKRGFGVKAAPGVPAAVAASEYERRATQVQLAFENWVLEDANHLDLARRAFSSSVRAYSTHPMEEKRFFHVRNLHLGHFAKSFGLREAPGKMGSTTQAKISAAAKAAKAEEAKKDAGKGHRKPSQGGAAAADVERDEDDSDVDLDILMGETSAAGSSGPRVAKYVPTTDAEKRMTAAVRAQGRLIKSGGQLGEQRMDQRRARLNRPGAGAGGSGGGGEFQVVNSGNDLEKLVNGYGGAGGAGQKRKR